MSFISNISVRYKLTVTLGLLILLLGLALYNSILSAQAASDDINEINVMDEIGLLATQLEVQSQQISTANQDSESIRLAVTRQINHTLALSSSISALFRGRTEVRREEFETFVETVLAEYPQVVTVEYIERVPNADREEHERQAQLTGFVRYEITEFNENGEIISAPQREEYYPATYVYPLDLAPNHLGFNQTSIEGRLVAMERARSTGQHIASEPEVLTISDREVPSVLLITPLYRSGDIPADPIQRHANLIGYIIISVNIDNFLNLSATTLLQDIFIDQIVDVTQPDTPVLFYVNSRSNPYPSNPIVEIPIESLGRRWIISLPQPVDVNQALEDIASIAAELQAGLTILQEGSEDVEGLARHNDAELNRLYQSARQQDVLLQGNVERLINTSNISRQAIYLSAIIAQAESLSALSDQMAGRLRDIAEERSQTTINFTLLGAVLGILLIASSLLILYQVLKDLAQVKDAAQNLAEGNLKARSLIVSQDEIGQIGNTLNTMAARLDETFTILESRIENRTRDLQAIIDVTNQVATVLDVSRLLQDVSDLTKDRFDLYHAHIYLLEDDGLILAAGAGFTGRKMVAEKRRISLQSEASIVAQAARTRQGVMINDVHSSPLFLPNPLLPRTRSELAVALVARGQVLGVLDIQSERKDNFTPEMLSIMDTLATQVAAALSNAKLYEVAERISRHEHALGIIERRMQDAIDIDEVLQSAARELGKALRVPYTSIELKLPDGNANQGDN